MASSGGAIHEKTKSKDMELLRWFSALNAALAGERENNGHGSQSPSNQKDGGNDLSDSEDEKDEDAVAGGVEQQGGMLLPWL